MLNRKSSYYHDQLCETLQLKLATGELVCRRRGQREFCFYLHNTERPVFTNDGDATLDDAIKLLASHLIQEMNARNAKQEAFYMEESEDMAHAENDYRNKMKASNTRAGLRLLK